MNAATREHLLRRVVFHGELAEAFGSEHSLAARSPADVVRAFKRMEPGFGRMLGDAHERGVAYVVLVDGEEVPESHLAIASQASIEIIPVPVGGKGGWTQIILGVVLIVAAVVAVVFGQPQLAFALGSLGVGQLIGGVTNLLSRPKDLADDDLDELPGSSISGTANLYQPGSPVPITLGETIQGSATANFGVFASSSFSSRQLARFMDILCEGEIDSVQQVYLDDVPIGQVQGAFYNYRAGTIDQQPLSLLGGTAQTTMKGVELDPGVFESAAATMPDEELRSIVVNLVVTQAVKNSSDGELQPTFLSYTIGIQDSTGAWVYLQSYTNYIRVTSRRNLSIGYDMRTAGGALRGTPPYTVYVRNDSHPLFNYPFKHVREMFWHSFVEYGGAALSHPHTAHVVTQYDSKSIPSIPRRLFHVRGLLCRIPSNYDPVARTYSGRWDGTFKADKAYTDNPAWCVLEVLLSARFGLGDWIRDDMVDHWDFYTAAQRSDEMVDDGFGGQEPRWRISGSWRRRKRDWSLIRELCSIMQCSPWWDGTRVRLLVDAPAEKQAVFNETNVIDGEFVYARTPFTKRTNRVYVRYQNPDDRYRPTTVMAQNQQGIALYGLNKREVAAIPGIASHGQATRHARAIYLTEDLQGESVTVRTGLNGMRVHPGEVFGTVDPEFEADRDGGRILEQRSDTSVKLDKVVTLESGETYWIDLVLPFKTEEQTLPNDATAIVLGVKLAGNDWQRVRVSMFSGETLIATRQPNGYTPGTQTLTLVPAPNNSDPVTYRIEYAAITHRATVTTAAGEHQVVEFDTALPTPIHESHVWVLTKLNATERLWRCVAIQKDGDHTFEIAGVLYDGSKYDQIEQGLTIATIPDTQKPPEWDEAPPEPIGLTAEWQIRIRNGLALPVLVIKWQDPDPFGVAGVKDYLVTWVRDGGIPESRVVEENELIVDGAEPGFYAIQVQSNRLDGQSSLPASYHVSITTDELPFREPLVTRLEVEGTGGSKWTGKNLRAAWGVTVPGYDFELGNSPDGDAEFASNPYVRDFVVRIRDAQTFNVLRAREIESLRFEYSLDDQFEDGGPRREVFVTVTARDHLRREGPEIRMLASNEAPAAPERVDYRTSVGSIQANVVGARDADEVGASLYAAKVSDYPGGGIPLTEETLRVVATDRFPMWAGAEEGEAYWVRIAITDEFSSDPALLNFSTEESVVAGKSGGVARDVVLQATATAATNGPATITADTDLELAGVVVGDHIEITGELIVASGTVDAVDAGAAVVLDADFDFSGFGGLRIEITGGGAHHGETSRLLMVESGRAEIDPPLSGPLDIGETFDLVDDLSEGQTRAIQALAGAVATLGADWDRVDLIDAGATFDVTRNDVDDGALNELHLLSVLSRKAWVKEAIIDDLTITTRLVTPNAITDAQLFSGSNLDTRSLVGAIVFNDVVGSAPVDNFLTQNEELSVVNRYHLYRWHSLAEVDLRDSPSSIVSIAVSLDGYRCYVEEPDPFGTEELWPGDRDWYLPGGVGERGGLTPGVVIVKTDADTPAVAPVSSVGGGNTLAPSVTSAGTFGGLPQWRYEHPTNLVYPNVADIIWPSPAEQTDRYKAIDVQGGHYWRVGLWSLERVLFGQAGHIEWEMRHEIDDWRVSLLELKR